MKLDPSQQTVPSCQEPSLNSQYSGIQQSSQTVGWWGKTLEFVQTGVERLLFKEDKSLNGVFSDVDSVGSKEARELDFEFLRERDLTSLEEKDFLDDEDYGEGVVGEKVTMSSYHFLDELEKVFSEAPGGKGALEVPFAKVKELFCQSEVPTNAIEAGFSMEGNLLLLNVEIALPPSQTEEKLVLSLPLDQAARKKSSFAIFGHRGNSLEDAWRYGLISKANEGLRKMIAQFSYQNKVEIPAVFNLLSQVINNDAAKFQVFRR